MANKTILIQIKASDQASTKIKSVETAITSLGKKATATVRIGGIETANAALNKFATNASKSMQNVVFNSAAFAGAQTSLDNLANKINASFIKPNQVISNFNSNLAVLGSSANAVNSALSSSFANVGKTVNDLKTQSATNLGIIANAATSNFEKINNATAKTGKTIHDMGNQFRYLSLAVGLVTYGVIDMVNGYVKSAAEMEQADVKLIAYSKIYGVNFNEAKKTALDFAGTGLMSVTEASTTLSNLLATGLGLDKAKILMQGMLDTAVTSKESLTDTYGQALVKSSQGMRIFQERLIDSVGINTQLNNVYKEYGNTINKHAKDLTNAEKYQAIYNYYSKEFANFTGAASAQTNTFSGTLIRLQTSLKLMGAELGNTLVPLIGSFSEGLLKAASSIRYMAAQHPAFTGAMITGTTAVLGLVTALATLGALIPMVQRGIQISTSAILTMASTSLLTIAKFSLLSITIGGVVYALLKATGQWDKWSNSLKNLANKISGAINPIKNASTAISETVDSSVKQLQKLLQKLSNSINTSFRDYKQDMADWVKKHDDSISDLKSQMTDLESQYKKSTDKIRQNFKDTMSDLELSHARKTEDIQQQLDEEVSKGIWADQTKIKDLKKELARENEDYALSKEKNQIQRDQDLQDEKDTYDEKNLELKKKLDEELAYETKYAKLIAEARTWPLLDEIQKRNQAFEDRLKQYQEELSEITTTSSGETDAIQNIDASLDNLGNTAKEVSDKINESFGTKFGNFVGNTIDSLKNAIDSLDLSHFWDNFKAGWPSSVEFLKEKWNDFCEYAGTQFKDVMTTIGAGDYTSGLISTSTGIFGSLLAMSVAMNLFKTSAKVGFTVAAASAINFSTLLSPVNLVLLTLVGSLELISWQYSKLQDEVESVNIAFDNENRLNKERLEQAKKNYEQGKITKQQYEDITEDVKKNTEAQRKSREELEKTSDVIGNFWPNLATGMKGIDNWINSTMKPFDDFCVNVGKKLRKSYDEWSTDYDNFFYNLGKNARNYWDNNISPAFSDGLSKIKTNVTSWCDNVKIDWNNFWSKIDLSYLNIDFGSIWNKVTDAFDNFKSSFSTLWNNFWGSLSLSNLASNVGNWFVNIGKSVLGLNTGNTQPVTTTVNAPAAVTAAIIGTPSSSSSSNKSSNPLSGISSSLLSSVSSTVSNISSTVQSISKNVSSAVSSTLSSTISAISKTIGNISSLLFFDTGGIVPGSPSTPVPIIAHGGEIVLPYGVKPINFNISINNPTVRNDQDIVAIANAVKDVISREIALKKFT